MQQSYKALIAWSTYLMISTVCEVLQDQDGGSLLPVSSTRNNVFPPAFTIGPLSGCRARRPVEVGITVQPC